MIDYEALYPPELRGRRGCRLDVVVCVLLHGAGGHSGMLLPYGRLLTADVVERARSGWPVVLLGASMGGMLAYSVATRGGVAEPALDDATADRCGTRADPLARPAGLRFLRTFLTSAPDVEPE